MKKLKTLIVAAAFFAVPSANAACSKYYCPTPINPAPTTPMPRVVAPDFSGLAGTFGRMADEEYERAKRESFEKGYYDALRLLTEAE